jgi:hypothetical protein
MQFGPKPPHIDLTRQRKTPIKGQMGYRNEMWAFRIWTLGTWEAFSAAWILALPRSGNVGRGGDLQPGRVDDERRGPKVIVVG